MALSEQYQQQTINTIRTYAANCRRGILPRANYAETPKSYIIKLGGLWEGFEPADEKIQEARKEIWQHLDTKITQ